MPQTLEAVREEFFKGCELRAHAPGSYFWSGEYAAMYGQLAVVHAIPLYAYAGIEYKNCKGFEFEFKEMRRDSSIVFKKATPEQIYPVERPEVTNRIGKYLEFLRKQNKQNYFKMKFWSEIPSRCGLNASGATAAALAGLLQILGTEKDKREALIRDINDWGNKPIEELKKDSIFNAIFRKAWILDDCAHDFLTSGTGPFSSLVGSVKGNLTLYFTEKKGFDSAHRVEPLSRNFVELKPEDFKQIEERINKIDWRGKRLPLQRHLKEWIGTTLVYSGIPVDAGKILSKWDESYKIPIEDFKSHFSKLFLECKTLTNISRPTGDFLKECGTSTLGSAFYAKSIFSESFGLLSWILVHLLDQNDREDLLAHITTINKFLDFYGVFPKELAELCKKIKGNYNVGIKSAGLGGGDFLIIGESDSMEGFESSIENTYPVHFSTNRMGWRADGLTILRPSRKKIAIVVPERDIIQNTMEIGFKKGEPYILINQRPPMKHFEEWLFAPLLVIAAYRKKDKKVNKETDLFLLKVRRREQLLTEIRQFLMTATFKTKVNRSDILPSDGSGNVELRVFEKDFITIDLSIRNFESHHMVPAEQAVDEILRLLKAKREQGLSDQTDPFLARAADRRKHEMGKSYRRLKQHEAKLTFKHTRLVMKAVEIMGWKFQNKNWWKRWDDLVTKCHVLFENLKYLDDREKDMEEELYLPQRRRQ